MNDPDAKSRTSDLSGLRERTAMQFHADLAVYAGVFNIRRAGRVYMRAPSRARGGRSLESWDGCCFRYV